MDTQLLLNGVIMAILLVSTGYMLRLNKRLSVMKQGFRDMRGLIDEFSSKVDRSETLLRDMRQASSEVSDAMNQQIGKAEQLHDDLATALAQANVSSNRLEKMLQAGERIANTAARQAAPQRQAVNEPARRPAPAQAQAKPQPRAPQGNRVSSQQAINKRAERPAAPVNGTNKRQPFQTAPQIAKPANNAGTFPARRLTSANEEAPAKQPIEQRDHGGPAGRVWGEEDGTYQAPTRTRSAIDSFFETMRSVAD